MTAKKPLEQLQEMTEQAGKTRQRSAKPPKDVSKDIERFYRAQLKSLVRMINQEIEEEVVPVVKQEKTAYKADAAPSYTADAWADRVIEAIRRISRRFVGGEFEAQYERLAQRTVSMAESETTSAFLKSVNKAVGVDLRPMLDEEGMREYVQAASWQNAELIKSIPEEYLKRVETAVVGGIRGGDAPTRIARNIREATGVTRRRAELIARDQTAKLTGEITERRQKQAGVKYFKWITSKDDRVGDDHRRAAQRDVGYGPGVYRWDKPPKEGVPGNSTRPNCFLGGETPNVIPGVRRLYRRVYRGRMTAITTALGDRIVTTPNHPLLTSRGWVAADSIKVGDKVVGVDKDSLDVSEMDGDKSVPRFSDLFETMSMIFGNVSRSGEAGDFHGDGVIDEEVDIVDVDSVLSGKLEAMGLKQGSHFKFALAVCDALGFRLGNGSSDSLSVAPFLASEGLMRCAYTLKSLAFGHLGHANDVRLATAANLYPVFAEYASDYVSRHAEVLGDSESALPISVELADRILIDACLVVWGVLVSLEPDAPLLERDSHRLGVQPEFGGDLRGVESSVVTVDNGVDERLGVHVYNLETSLGWYNIDSVTAKNCRCTAKPVFEWELPDKAKRSK